MIFDALARSPDNWLADIKPSRGCGEAGPPAGHAPRGPAPEAGPGNDERSRRSTSGCPIPSPPSRTTPAACCSSTPSRVCGACDEQRMFIDCVPLDSDEARYNDTPLERAMCEALKARPSQAFTRFASGSISSPAQRAGSWLALGELLWIVTGTVTEQHTTIADFNALPEPGKAAMAQGVAPQRDDGDRRTHHAEPRVQPPRQ